MPPTMRTWASTGRCWHVLTDDGATLCGRRHLAIHDMLATDTGHPGVRALAMGMVCGICQRAVAVDTIRELHVPAPVRGIVLTVDAPDDHMCDDDCYLDEDEPDGLLPYMRWHSVPLCACCGDWDSDDSYVPWPCATVLAVYQPFRKAVA